MSSPTRLPWAVSLGLILAGLVFGLNSVTYEPRDDLGLCPHGRHLPGVGLRLRGPHLEPGDGLDQGRAEVAPGVKAAPGSRPSVDPGARTIRSLAVSLRAASDRGCIPRRPAP